VLSRNKFLTTKEHIFFRDIQVMKKLNLRQLRWIIRQCREGDMSVYRIAKQQGITPRYVRMLHRRFQDVPDYLIEKIRLKKCGRKQKPIDDYERKMVLDVYEKMPLCAVKMEKYHELLQIPRVPHNRIHRILTEAGIAKPVGKRVQRKKGVRYERRHSNSLWHTDFSDAEDGKIVIAYIDDASRKIMGYAKLDNATTDNALLVLNKAIKKYGKPKQIMTDHGTQFCADEEKVYRFREALKEMGIEHIMARVKRPQTNGKIERWFGSMDRLYLRFEYDLDRLVECYNNMPHMSLDTTPNQAFVDKMRKQMAAPITIKR
jgi:putative transposase